MDLHVLPLYGTDLVLGVQWLKSMGPILTDYNELTMKFIRDDNIIELKRGTDSGLHSITPAQLCCMIKTNSVNVYFYIHILPFEPPSIKTNTTSTPRLNP